MLGALFVGMVMTQPALLVHDWYSGLLNEKGESCCGGSDCAEISDEDVTPVPGGYQVHIPSFKGQALEAYVPNARAKPAKEGGQYHMCYWDHEIKCFFFPAPTY